MPFPSALISQKSVRYVARITSALKLLIFSNSHSGKRINKKQKHPYISTTLTGAFASKMSNI